jgi:hypothetical protein
MLLVLFTSAVHAGPGQLQPDIKRQREIRLSLASHGYQPGTTWAETQSILRQIARDHHWQTKHAPDARVLILLQLGNKMSDPDVLTWPKNHLDP